MRPLSIPELLNVWERGLAARPFERALSILSAASPESSLADLASVSIGRRDASLFRLREWAFGPDLAMVAICPRCQRALETVLTVADLCRPGDPPSGPETSLLIKEYKFRCRPPTTEDVEACARLDEMMSRRELFARCVLESSYQGEPIAAEQLDNSIVDAVIERIAEADQADIRINLSCPECRYGWNELFDIVSFFWTEIDGWARRLLHEVNTLASAYGWRESDILALSPVRRQIYLAMVEET
jgi:hypothetical protein